MGRLLVLGLVALMAVLVLAVFPELLAWMIAAMLFSVGVGLLLLAWRAWQQGRQQSKDQTERVGFGFR